MRARTETASPVRAARRFITLPENRAARLAIRRLALAVRSGRRCAAALLFLHGPAGTGKTHLVAWLLRACRRRTVAMLAAADWDGVTDTLSTADLLIVEDVQHLPPPVAEKFGALLDERSARRRPTVLTAHAGPADLSSPRRLLNRYAAGLTVPLGIPGCTSRRRILEQFAAAQSARFTAESLDWLANNSTGSIRQLRAAWQRLAGDHADHAGPLELADVRARWDNLPLVADVRRVVEMVAQHYQVTVAELHSADRHTRLTLPRHVSMYLASCCTGLSAAQIGWHFGGRDASTVRHAYLKIADAVALDPALAVTIREFKQKLS